MTDNEFDSIFAELARNTPSGIPVNILAHPDKRAAHWIALGCHSGAGVWSVVTAGLRPSSPGRREFVQSLLCARDYRRYELRQRMHRDTHAGADPSEDDLRVFAAETGHRPCAADVLARSLALLDRLLALVRASLPEHLSQEDYPLVFDYAMTINVTKLYFSVYTQSEFLEMHNWSRGF